MTKKTIAKAKTAINELWTQMVQSGQSSYQWLPEFQGSHMQDSGAPKGTPFLGTVANIEFSIGVGSEQHAR